MKLNLLLNSPGACRSGYVNVDPLAPEGDLGRVRAEVSDLSSVVDAGEAKEIVALDILDYFPVGMSDDVLQNWLSRLGHGGRLTLSVVDVREVARGLLDGKLTIDQGHELLHGAQRYDWEYRKSLFTLSHLVEVLTNLGFRVLRKFAENYRAVVTVERP